MPDTLYDDDVLAWSEQQAALLRRAAGGELVNGLDWPNLIEEIDSVGRSELHACRSLLLQGLRHLLKCAASPDNEAVGRWRAEAATFLPQAADSYMPSMRQKIDLALIYRQALNAARQEGIGDVPLVEHCPFLLDDLLLLVPDLNVLIARLGTAALTRPS